MGSQGLPASAKCYALTLIICMLLATVFEIVAISGPWWGADEVAHDVTMTLWNIRVQSTVAGGNADGTDAIYDKDVGWDEFCGVKYMNDDEWCTKISAARGTSIVAAILAFFSVVSISCGFNKLVWVYIGVTCVFLSSIFSSAALGLGMYFPGNTKLDTPGYGFILLCVGSGLNGICIVVVIVGLCCTRCGSGFDKLDGGSSWGAWKPERKAQQPPPMRPMGMPMPQPMPIGTPYSRDDFGVAGPAGQQKIAIGNEGFSQWPAQQQQQGSQMPPLPVSGGDFGLGSGGGIAPPASFQASGMSSAKGRSSANLGGGRASGGDFGICKE